MKKDSHLLMGRLLIQYVRDEYGLTLDQRKFLLGSVLPDYLPTFLSRPHFLKYSEEHVRKLIGKMIARFPDEAAGERRRARYARQLGMLCHFYTDFFCHAHSPRFSEGPRRHRRYELELARFFRANFEAFRAAPLAAAPGAESTQEIFERFQRLQQSYLSDEQTFVHDISYAFFACAELVGMILSRACVQTPALEAC